MRQRSNLTGAKKKILNQILLSGRVIPFKTPELLEAKDIESMK